jgi:hypothetical protein
LQLKQLLRSGRRRKSATVCNKKPGRWSYHDSMDERTVSTVRSNLDPQQPRFATWICKLNLQRRSAVTIRINHPPRTTSSPILLCSSVSRTVQPRHDGIFIWFVVFDQFYLVSRPAATSFASFACLVKDGADEMFHNVMVLSRFTCQSNLHLFA